MVVVKRAEIAGIRMDVPTASPVLLLRIESGPIHVPLWIGSSEASIIALYAEGVEAPRPLTHDLLLDVAAASGRALDHVEISRLVDDVFEASLVFDDGGRVDARASDAVALAVRAQTPILVDDAVDSGVVVAVSAADGTLLWVEGDPTACRRAEAMNFVPGADWSERGAGTNAPGTALALDTVGHVTRLHRVKAGPFALGQAITLDKLDAAAKASALEPLLLPLRAGLDDIPAFSLTPDQAGALRQGRVLDGIAADDGLVFACTGDTPVALAEVEANQLRVVRGFNL